MVDKQLTKTSNPELLEKVRRAVSSLVETQQDITFDTVARLVGVARSTLYRNPAVRQLIMTAKSPGVQENDIAVFKEELSKIRQILDEISRNLEHLVHQSPRG